MVSVRRSSSGKRRRGNGAFVGPAGEDGGLVNAIKIQPDASSGFAVRSYPGGFQSMVYRVEHAFQRVALSRAGRGEGGMGHVVNDQVLAGDGLLRTPGGYAVGRGDRRDGKLADAAHGLVESFFRNSAGGGVFGQL